MLSGLPTCKFIILSNVHLFCIQQRLISGVYDKEGAVRLVLKRLSWLVLNYLCECIWSPIREELV